MVRPPCCDKQNVKRGHWSAEEDAKILAYVSKHGTGNWAAAPRKAGSFAGLRRCGKSCRLRWTNYLRPDLKHDDFTPQEEELIVRLHAAIGSRWSIIAQQLPGRTDNDVKNYWNTKLRKKLSEMGIDPVTHKPFSQILADYGSIGGLLKSGNRIGSLNRDLKNAFSAKPKQYSSRPEGVSNINSHLMTTGVPTKEEPVQECFLNSNFNNDTDYNQPLDLLDQLQAIKLLTEATSCGKCETNSVHFHNEGPLSSTTSSTSSTCSTAAQDKSSADFSWRDFLLEDVFLPIDPQEQQNQEFPSKDFTDQKQQNVEPKCQNAMILPQGQVNCEVLMTSHAGIEGDLPATSHSHDQIPSCSSSSFVASILDQENEILLDFPGLLEEPFYF